VGVQFSTNSNLNNHQSAFGSLGASFTIFLTGLTPNTTYFYRAVIAAPGGNQFGEIIRFTTSGPHSPTPVPTGDARRAVDSAYSAAQDLEVVSEHTLTQAQIDRVQTLIDDAWALVNPLPGGVNKTQLENNLRLAQEWVVAAQFRLTSYQAVGAMARAREAVQWLINNSSTFTLQDIENADRLIEEARAVADRFPVGRHEKTAMLAELDSLQRTANVHRMVFESRFIDADLRNLESAINHLASNVDYFEQGELNAARALYNALVTRVNNMSVENPDRPAFIGRLAEASSRLDWLQRSLDTRLARFEVDRARTEAFSRLNVDGYDTKENLDTVKRLIDQAQEQLNILPDSNDHKVFLQSRLTDAFNRWQLATWAVENREAQHLVERAAGEVDFIDPNGTIRPEDVKRAQDAINLARARVNQMLDTNPNKEILIRNLNLLQVRLDEIQRLANSGHASVLIGNAETAAYRLKRDGFDSQADIDHARNAINVARRFVQDNVPDSLQPEKRNMLTLLDNLLRLQVNEAELARTTRQRLTSLRNTINSFLIAQRLPSFSQLNNMTNMHDQVQSEINRMDFDNQTRWNFHSELSDYRAQLDNWRFSLFN
jgi:hypothetical protein